MSCCQNLFKWEWCYWCDVLGLQFHSSSALCTLLLPQLESQRAAPEHDAAGERALAAQTAHHETMTREVEAAQQQAALALRRSSEVEQALAAAQAVSVGLASRAGRHRSSSVVADTHPAALLVVQPENSWPLPLRFAGGQGAAGGAARAAGLAAGSPARGNQPGRRAG